MKEKKETLYGINIRALFSRNLKRLRSDAKLSQLSLASEADLAHNFINDIECGKKWVSAETLGKLAAALKAEPYQFFLSESIWNDQTSELLSIYLDDIEKTHTNMVADFRKRFLADDKEDEGEGKPVDRLIRQLKKPKEN